mgnify:CR=1 FL=1
MSAVLQYGSCYKGSPADDETRPLMKTIRFFLRTAPKSMLFTALLSAAAGAFNGALVAIVHRALTGASSPFGSLGMLFILACIGKLSTGYFSEVSLVRSAQVALADLRLGIVRQLQHIPFREFERLGTARVLSTLTDDVTILGLVSYQLPALAVNFAVISGGLGYLAFLSWKLLIASLLFASVGALVYGFVLRHARSLIAETRSQRDLLNGYFLSMTHGMKELKLHRGRRDAHTRDGVGALTEKLMALDVATHRRFIGAHIASHFFLFGCIGLIVFVAADSLNLTEEVVTGYVFTALYLLGPVSGAASALPTFSRASVSLSRVESLGVSLKNLASERVAAEGEPSPFEPPMQAIELKQAICRYEADGESFVLGPIDLTVKPGEILFITGGNGSGKSTLAKVLVGLYGLNGGEHLCNGTAVTEENCDDYRQLFSAVFSDYYLFESLLGLSNPDLDRDAAKYLEKLQLTKKVTVLDGELSTTQLSQGQRKRLALLTAYLENRSIYLFDEWAADQDSSFKELFYRTLLPELKSRGKTVIVISHDDRYFDAGDRRIHMREGKIGDVL